MAHQEELISTCRTEQLTDTIVIESDCIGLCSLLCGEPCSEPLGNVLKVWRRRLVLDANFTFSKLRLPSTLNLTRRPRVSGFGTLSNEPAVPHKLVPIDCSALIDH